MNTGYSRWRSKRMLPVVNLSVASAMLFGNFLGGVAQAATQTLVPAQSNTVLCQTPDSTAPTASNRIFLPLVSNLSVQAVADTLGLSQVAGVTSTPRQLRYQVGKTYVYEWKLNIETRTISRDAQGDHDRGGDTSVIYALADVSILEQTADGSFNGEVILRQPFVCSNDGIKESKNEDPALQQALQVPLRFQQRADGVITSISLPATVESDETVQQATNFQKGILNALQVTLRADTNQYSAEERGGQGTYVANYTLEEQSGGMLISKGFDKASFKELITAGDQAKALDFSTTTKAFLDANQGILTSIDSSEKMTSASDQVPTTGTDESFVGVTIWSTATSSNKLSFKEVKDTPVSAAAQPDVVYSTGDMGAILVKPPIDQSGIDIETIDLNAEFAKFENEPENPTHFSRILALHSADVDGLVIAKISERLSLHAGNDTLAKLYVDLLAAIKEPVAQDLLNNILGGASLQAANLASSVSITVQEHALIGLVLLDSPTITTVTTVKNISGASDSRLQETAVSVLGAAIHNLVDEDPATAQTLASELVNTLATVTETADVQLYLNALGNAGLPSTLNTILPYVNGSVHASANSVVEDFDVRSAALTALRRFPGKEVEAIYVASLQDKNEEYALRLQAASILLDRPDLSSEAANALQTFLTANLAEPGENSRTWNSEIGNSNAGVEFPGGVTIKSPPTAEYLSTVASGEPSSIGVSVYTFQNINGLFWHKSFKIAKAEVRAQREGDKIRFRASIELLGNLVRKAYDETVNCKDYRAGNLWSGDMNFINLTYRIPVAGVITVNFNLRLDGHAALDYELNVDACDIVRARASATIIPRAKAVGKASGDASIWIARGGVAMEATLFDTRMPTTASVLYANNKLRFCIDATVIVRPLSGRLYAFADVKTFKKWKFRWKRVWEGTLWEFALPERTYKLLNRCN